MPKVSLDIQSGNKLMQLAHLLKKIGSFYYHYDCYATHYVKVMLDQIFWENNSRIRRVEVRG